MTYIVLPTFLPKKKKKKKKKSNRNKNDWIDVATEA